MMMQGKLVVSNRHAASVMTNDFSTHVERLILKTLLWFVLFCPENLFYRQFFFYRQLFFSFPSSQFWWRVFLEYFTLCSRILRSFLKVQMSSSLSEKLNHIWGCLLYHMQIPLLTPWCCFSVQWFWKAVKGEKRPKHDKIVLVTDWSVKCWKKKHAGLSIFHVA